MQNDANMSDSQFMRFQEKVQDKMKNYVDNLDRESRMRELKRRFEASKRRKKTFWEKLTTLFRR
jgi:hypothetical protein